MRLVGSLAGIAFLLWSVRAAAVTSAAGGQPSRGVSTDPDAGVTAVGPVAQVAPPVQASGTVIVFPFANITGNPTDDWMGAGIADTVATDLQRARLVSVALPHGVTGAARGQGDSSGSGGNGEGTALELGRRSGARWVLTGAYQRSGDRLRVTARLLEVSTGRVLAVAKVDGAATELFALQDRIAAELTAALRSSAGGEAEAVRDGSRVPDTGATRTATSPDASPAPAPVDGESANGSPEADEAPVAADLAGLAGLIDGPPPPVAPDVMSRDELGRVTIRAVRLTQPLRVDGRLDERAYATVPPITGFIQNIPDEGRSASQETEAWIFFDREHVYIAARCWDTAPESEWVENEMRRDLWRAHQNDNFGFLLDTFYDRRNGYHMYANPVGAIVDQQVTNEGNPNRDWNPVWRVRTGRFDEGWTVEMAIPFKSIRYRPGASQIWGIQLRRTIARRNEHAYITALPLSAAGRDGTFGILRVSMAATLVGLEVPAGSKNLDVKPYAIAGLMTDRAASRPRENDLARDAGLDVKYGLTQNLTLDFTYNTDFAQVEVDEQQVNLTRFSLFFPEKREFFLEGRGIFEFARGGALGGGGGGWGGLAPQLFFSRRIGLSGDAVVPILAGARLTGKVGGLTLGALSMQTDRDAESTTPGTNFTVLRLKQDVLRRSSVGVMATGRSPSAIAKGRWNQAYGVDASFSFYENVNFNGYYARTETPGLIGRPESYQARFDYSADRYGVAAEHLFVGDAFNPEIGFVRRHGMRRNFASVRFSPRPSAIRSVRRFIWEASGELVENMAGALETRQYSAGFETEFESSDRLNIEAGRQYELLIRPFQIAPGVSIPIGGYDFTIGRGSFQLGLSRRLSGTFAVEYGGFYDGKLKAVEYAQGRLGLTGQLSLEPSASVAWIDLPFGSFRTELYRTRLNYTFTPRMFLSGLIQYNSTTESASANLRLRWEYSPGSELFIVYTEDRDTDTPVGWFAALQNRALVIKLNRLFRF